MQPVVNIHDDQKSPVMLIAVMGMMTIQLAVLGLIAWKMLSPPAPAANTFAQDSRNQVYREIIGQWATTQPPGEATGITERVENLARENVQLNTSDQAKTAMITNLQQERALLLRDQAKDREQLKQQEEQLTEQSGELLELRSEINKLKEDPERLPVGLPWLYAISLAVLTAVLGMFGGGFIASRFRDFDEPYEADREEPPIQQEPEGPEMTFGDGSEP